MDSPVAISILMLTAVPLVAFAGSKIGGWLASLHKDAPASAPTPGVVVLTEAAEDHARLVDLFRPVGVAPETLKPDMDKLEEDFHAYVEGLRSPGDQEQADQFDDPNAGDEPN